MKERLVVIVPIYQSILSADEQLSIHRLRSLCAAYPLCVVAPNGIEIPDAMQGMGVERFDTRYFQSVFDYNRLMLSEEFYARFANYEYMLVHQTDAFLFRDELSLWFNKGYPYVGAPWQVKRKYRGVGRIVLYLRAIPHRVQGRAFLPLDYADRVGNGGLSLRRVEDFRMVCRECSAEIERWIKKSLRYSEYNEDCFWATRPEWRYPSWQEALQFAFDLDPKDAYIQNQCRLPMGCHGWTKTKVRSFWWQYIEEYKM